MEIVGYILLGALATFAEWTFKGAAIFTGFVLADKIVFKKKKLVS